MCTGHIGPIFRERGETVARPKKPLISRTRVIETALMLIDRDGLAKLSLTRLAAELGVHNSSVYYHYRYKADILADVLRLVLGSFVVDADADINWKNYLLEYAPKYLEKLNAHPQVVSLLVAQTPKTLGLEFENQTAAILLKAGFPPEYVIVIREHLEVLTVGALQFSNNSLFEDVPDSLPELRSVVDAARSMSTEDRFRLALKSYVDGLEIQLTAWTDGTSEFST
nr:TetR/AcrR family transcriptional regulator [Rhodococcus erythropolis]